MASEELRTILTSGQIPDIKLNSTDASASVATKGYVDTEINALENSLVTQKGLLALYKSTIETVSIQTTFDTIAFIDATVLDAANSHIEYDFVNDRIVLKSVGVYQAFAFGTIGGESNIDYEFSYFIENTETPTGAHPVFIGAGLDKPFTANDGAFITITQAMLDDITVSPSGQVWLDIRAKASSLADLKVHSATLSIEKKV